MGNADNVDRQNLIHDFIHDTTIPNADSVGVVGPGEFFTTVRARSPGQGVNGFGDSPPVGIGDLSERLFGLGFDPDLIGHGL